MHNPATNPIPNSCSSRGPSGRSTASLGCSSSPSTPRCTYPIQQLLVRGELEQVPLLLPWAAPIEASIWLGPEVNIGPCSKAVHHRHSHVHVAIPTSRLHVWLNVLRAGVGMRLCSHTSPMSQMHIQ